jgi:seryl-tRNA synthetase
MSGVTSGDYSGLTEVIDSFSQGFDEALEEISNEEVEAPLTSIAADYKEIGAALEKLAEAGSDPAKIAELSELSDQMTETSSRLQESSTELQELCA